MDKNKYENIKIDDDMIDDLSFKMLIESLEQAKIDQQNLRKDRKIFRRVIGILFFIIGLGVWMLYELFKMI